LKRLVQIVTKEIPFSLTWVHVVIISSLIGGLFVFITLYFEPHGTDGYQVPYRNLLLSGYALCHIIPYLLFYGLERRAYQWKANRWQVYDELISKSGLIIAMATASWFYNIRVINDISPTWSRWAEHLIYYGLPYIPLLAPAAILLHIYFSKRSNYAVAKDQNMITIHGKNREDHLEIAEDQFIYAESDQNYVTIFFLEDGEVEKKVIRSTLKNVQRQVAKSERIHRSYLINPNHLKRLTGNKRQRFADLHHIENPIPISAEHDHSTLKNGSS
jgi:ribosomal protein L25 (general stress protein Ctc)